MTCCQPSPGGADQAVRLARPHFRRWTSLKWWLPSSMRIGRIVTPGARMSTMNCVRPECRSPARGARSGTTRSCNRIGEPRSTTSCSHPGSNCRRVPRLGCAPTRDPNRRRVRSSRWRNRHSPAAICGRKPPALRVGAEAHQQRPALTRGNPVRRTTGAPAASSSSLIVAFPMPCRCVLRRLGPVIPDPASLAHPAAEVSSRLPSTHCSAA